MSEGEAAWYMLVLGRLMRRPGLVLAGDVVDLVYLFSQAVREHNRHTLGE
jgi:hypothetical protein